MGYWCGHDEDAVRNLRLDSEKARGGDKINESVCSWVYKYRYILSKEWVGCKNESFKDF